MHRWCGELYHNYSGNKNIYYGLQFSIFRDSWFNNDPFSFLVNQKKKSSSVIPMEAGIHYFTRNIKDILDESLRVYLRAIVKKETSRVFQKFIVWNLWGFSKNTDI